MAAADVPVIDLRLAGASPEERARLRAACERAGCFRVTGHGVPAGLLAEMKAAVRALFDLPDDAKRRNADVIPGSGYVGVVTVKSYAERMHEVIVDVAGKLAWSLGLEGHSFEDWPCQFRINRYNYTHNTVGSSGVQIHNDSSFLTVLQEDECVGGLEVLDPAAGEFVPVDPVAGSFLVNTGDVGTAWSNGRLHNVKHRVLCVAPVPRISIAMFLLAPKDDRVSTPEAFIDADHPRRYMEFNHRDYRRLRLSNGEHAGEALARLAA